MKHVYPCCCGNEFISLDKDEDIKCISFAIYYYGSDSKRLSLVEALKYCWFILVKRTPYSDQILLSTREAKRLGKDLIKLSENK